MALNTCYISNKSKIFGTYDTFKPFLTKNKERLYLRIAMLHLEKEGLIEKLPNPSDIKMPIYLITYSGLILVRNGGYCKKLVLDRFKEFLQRLAWLFTIIGLFLNVYIHRDKFTSCDISTNQKTEVKVAPQQKTKVFQK